MRRLALAGLLLPLVACVHAPAVVRAPQPVPTTLWAVQEVEHAVEVRAVPTPLIEALAQACRERNLAVAEGQVDKVALQTARDSHRRVAMLQAAQSKLGILLESRVVFFAQVDGRFRWTVLARLTLFSPGKAFEPQVIDLSLPVALNFAHEGPDDALTAVRSLVAGRLAAALDQLLLDQTAIGGGR
jgi:hypothetical protein